MNTYMTSDVAKIIGIHPNTVRMYEEWGLIPLAERKPNGYRVFTDYLVDADFIMPKFIRVTDRDKRRTESEVCQGSIGYCSEQKGLHIVNVFRDSTEAFGLSFYPDSDSEFYYVDPTDRDRYIALDEYFSYLKVARVNEL